MAESRILPTVGALSGTEELCKHFCKTGKCKHDVHCRYVHDRSKVSLCRLFLRGECSKPADACFQAHEVDPSRTPECGLFLRGMCGDANCRYLHVKKSVGAPDCDDFLNAWCPLGIACPKRHYVPPPDRKREREEPDRPELSEDEILQQIWKDESTLNVYD